MLLGSSKHQFYGTISEAKEAVQLAAYDTLII